jgi:hypothetical protein
MRLAVLFRIPPSELDERMAGRDAADILDHLAAFPQTEEILDIQLSRIVQMLSGLGGNKVDFEKITMRGFEATEEEIAEDWIRYLDERENRIKN